MTIAKLLLLIAGTLLTATGTRSQELTQTQREAFRAAKTARVIVKQSYENAPGVNLSFERNTRGVLKYVGLAVIQPDATADVTFEIDVRGWALSRRYQFQDYSGVATLYTGASVRGSIALTASGIAPYFKSFQGEIDPPRSISRNQVDHYRSAAQAPFHRAFFAGKESFPSVLPKLIADIYGDEVLAGAFVDEDNYIRGIGIEALRRLDASKAVAMSIAALRHPNSATQKAGEIALSSLAARPEALDLLLIASKDSDRNVRRATIFALGDVRDERARDKLIQGLYDPDTSVRFWSANRLAVNYDRRATEPLIVALKDSDAGVRREVARALGRGGSRSIEPLIAALKDKDQYVRYAVSESLKEITRQDLGEDPKAWQKWWKANKRTYEEADALMRKIQQKPQ